jgi:predicted amidohydrolase
MKLALWTENLAYPVASLRGWAELVEQQAATVKKSGAEVLLLPEYAAIHWIHFLGNLKGKAQFAKLAELSAEAVTHISAIAKKHDMLIVSGTLPVLRPELDPAYSNRAHIHFPDGKVLTQDKLCLLRVEKKPSEWAVSPGNTIQVFSWKGYKMAVVICLDIELPALSAQLAGQDLDLILVPSMTTKLAGYHRVFDCAKARAVELFAAIAVTGAIAGPENFEQYISGNSIFVPCEEKFGHTGILASTPPSYKADGAGPLLICDVPLDEIRKMRQDGAEVWPGAWTANHVVVKKS